MVEIPTHIETSELSSAFDFITEVGYLIFILLSISFYITVSILELLPKKNALVFFVLFSLIISSLAAGIPIIIFLIKKTYKNLHKIILYITSDELIIIKHFLVPIKIEKYKLKFIKSFDLKIKNNILELFFITDGLKKSIANSVGFNSLTIKEEHAIWLIEKLNKILNDNVAVFFEPSIST